MHKHPNRPPQDDPNSVTRRALLRGAGLTAGAVLAGPLAARPADAAKDNKKSHVVPAPVYFPTSYVPEVDLAGKNIVITGASRGIGRAVALELLQAGANVWGTSRTPLASPAVIEYPLLELDLEDPASIMGFVTDVGAATAGRVDVLINNAGRFVFGSTTPLSADPALFTLWAQNSALGLQNLYFGPRMLTAAMLGFMQHPGYRRILFTVSAVAYISGADIGSFLYQPYVAGKRALLDYVNSLRDWFGLAGLDIGVASVNPANTNTDLPLGVRPIFLEPVDANGNPDPASPLALFLPLIRAAAATGQPPTIVARAYRQLLELQAPPPNVIAAIPEGQLAEAAQLELFMATAQKEMEASAMPWVKG